MVWVWFPILSRHGAITVRQRIKEISRHIRNCLPDIALGNKPEEYAEAKEKALKKQEAEQLYQQAFAAHYGLNRHPDHLEALRLYERSALLGHGKAQTNLGMMYYNGHGTAQNYAKAAEWFEKAALNHDAMAQYNLACLYFNGTGIAHDADEACRWWSRYPQWTRSA